MDEKVRDLERQSLSGDCTATEALLHEQQRAGLYYKEHYIFSFTHTMLSAGGGLVLRRMMPFNFELHSIWATSSAPFLFEPEDGSGKWTNGPIHSNCLVNGSYTLLIPRFIPANSSIDISLTDISLSSNEIYLEMHGIRTAATKK